VRRSRLLVLAAIAVLVAAFFALGGHRYLSLEALRAQQASIQEYYAAHPWQAALGYFLVYVAVTGLSLPGAAVLTLFGGAVFGLLWCTVIVSFASSIGATLAFLASRFLLRDWVQARFGDRLKPVNDGVAQEGALYLFALRLVPAFPFFVINLVMGLTTIRTWTFYWVSQLACSPAPSSTSMPARSSASSGCPPGWWWRSRCSAFSPWPPSGRSPR